MKILKSKRFVASILAASLGSFSLGAKSESQEITFKCLDDINEAKAEAKATMVAGTVVGLVLGSETGNPQVGIFGAYVGCKAGKLFAEAYKKDPIAASVLLGQNLFVLSALEQSGQKMYVFAQKIPEKVVDNATPPPDANLVQSALNGAGEMPLTPTVGATAGALHKLGMDPEEIALTLSIAMPTEVAVASILESGEAQRAKDGFSREFRRAEKEIHRAFKKIF